MSDLINSLNWQLWEAASYLEEHVKAQDISSFLLMLLTAALVYYTMALAREAKLTREQSVAPAIFIHFEPCKASTMHLDLVIENSGTGGAYDVEIVDEANNAVEGKPINDLPFLSPHALKPKQQIRHFIGSYAELQELTFEFKATCKSSSGKEYRQDFTVCPGTLLGLGKLGEEPSLKIANAVEKISQDINALTGFKRVGVDCYTQKERDAERKAREKQRKEFSKKQKSQKQTKSKKDQSKR